MKPLRRSQAISPFGVGAILDFQDDSLVLASPDIWIFSKTSDPDVKIDEYELYEERLAVFLGVEKFYTPPDYRIPPVHAKEEDRINTLLRLPFIRFPLSYVCSACKKIHRALGHQKTAPECYCSSKMVNKTHPARFVAACKKGHIQDFPWDYWVFKGSPPQDLHKYDFFMRGGSSSGLNGIIIECKDKSGKLIKKRTMAGAFSKLDKTCDGLNPVKNIPNADQPVGESCTEILEARLRTSTDLWQSKIYNSIYIPKEYENISLPIKTILGDPIFDNSVLKNFRADEAVGLPRDEERQIIFIKNYLDNHHSEKEITPKEIYDALYSEQPENQKVGTDTEDEAFKREEYNAIINGVTDAQNLLIKSIDVNQYKPIVSKHFSQISLIHKLRETRAFVGFSRLGAKLDLEDMWKLMSDQKYEKKKWYPAIEVKGEGLFFQFSDEKLNGWMDSYEIELRGRIKNMQDSFVKRYGTSAEPPSAKYILMHTFAHILINQLIYDCGYGSASLRERIYCTDADNGMSGILIYTSAGDSEGTMGGLVRMGMPGILENTIKKALEDAQWCSSDPICIESEGQGNGSVNKAACHNCALIAETSCENFNCSLDRGLLIGTLDDNKLGYFSD